MSTRPVGTRRPRLLPGVLIASGLVVAAAFTTVAATAGPDRQSVQTCGTGQDWVTVQPAVVGVTEWSPWQFAGATDSSPPTIAGCVDTRHLPTTTGQTDSRG